jgi:hypothetical protein
LQLQQEEKVSEEGIWQEPSNFVFGMMRPTWKTKRMKKTAKTLFFIFYDLIKIFLYCQHRAGYGNSTLSSATEG